MHLKLIAILLAVVLVIPIGCGADEVAPSGGSVQGGENPNDNSRTSGDRGRTDCDSDSDEEDDD